MTPIIRFLTIAITVAISQLGSEAIAKPDAASNFSNAVRFLEDERMDDALIALRAGCLEGVEDGYELMCDAVLSYYETGTTGLIAEPESVRHAGAIEAFDMLKKASTALLDEDKRKALDETVMEARVLVLRELSLPADISTDDERIVKQVGVARFQELVRARTKDVMIGDELRKRK